MEVFLALGHESMKICLLWPLYNLLALVLGLPKHICVQLHVSMTYFQVADCASTNLCLGECLRPCGSAHAACYLVASPGFGHVNEPLEASLHKLGCS